MTTKSMGQLTMARTPPNKVAEVCAQLTAIHNTTQNLLQENGQPAPHKWFFHLFNLRFVLLNDLQGKALAANSVITGTADAAASAAAVSSTPHVGLPSDVPMQVRSEPAQYQHFTPSAEMLELETQLRAAARASGGAAVATHGQPDLHLPTDAATAALLGMRLSRNSSSSMSATAVPATAEQVWRQLQRRHQWPDGQLVFQSMYRPCVSDEANSMCVEDCGLM
jgi:hypothetical protein